MFTGIIEDIGIVKQIQSNKGAKIFVIGCNLDLPSNVKGDSIAVNGACLTIVEHGKNFFKADVSLETIHKTNFKYLKSGSKVNLERALRLSDRIDGHLVSGHVDGIAKISLIKKQSNSIIINFALEKNLAEQMIQKGSVAVDGISLTINHCSDKDFEVNIIPHTAKITTLGLKKVNDRVNIETDMLGKYVKQILTSSYLKNDTMLKKIQI